jgi:hypothetical protein
MATNNSVGEVDGSDVYFAGGGAGGGDAGAGDSTGGLGGGGNGKSGAPSTQVPGTSGDANTGGGAGGSTDYGAGGSAPQPSGGSGVVIISMPDANYSGITTGSPTVDTGISGKTVLTFKGTGTYTA